MTDLPYTDADLRAEAAHQHSGLTEDPDFMGVGEQMEDSFVPSLRAEDSVPSLATTWSAALDGDDYGDAQRKIHDLINGAADVSEWAVDLGAAGLTETVTHGWYCQGRGWELAVQIAHRPQIKPEVRDEVESAVRRAVERVLAEHGLTAYLDT
jgi:hypothetical protein